MENRYRTRKEMIDLFKWYANGFRKEAREMEKSCCFQEMNIAIGKAEAYEIAAFELEHNMEGCE